MEVLENIAAVELSRIAGYKYPDDDVELKQLQLLFATPLHIAAGDIVYTAPVAEPCDHVTKSGIFNSTELGFNYYFVKYIKLEVKNSTTINEAVKSNTSNMNSVGNPDEINYASNLSLELNSLRPTIKKKGRVTERSAVTLQGRTNHFLLTSSLMSNNKSMSDVGTRNSEDAISQSCIGDFGNSSTTLLSNSISDLSAVYHNILRLVDFETTDEEDMSYTASRYSDDSHAVDDGYANHVMPYSVSDGTIFGLIASPLLIQSPCGEEDMRTIVLKASQRLGMCSVTLDARMLFENYSDEKTTNYSSSFPSSFQEKHRPGLCNTVDVTSIVRLFSPCILIIENLDALIYGGISGEPNSQAQNEENEFQEVFAVILGKFLDNLQGAIAESARAKSEEAESKELKLPSFKTHLLNSAVFVTAVTSSLERLKPSLRTVFPSELVLAPIPDSQVDQHLADILSDHNNHQRATYIAEYNPASTPPLSSSSSYGVDYEGGLKDAVKTAAGLSVEGGMGLSGALIRAVFDEAALRRAQQDNGHAWLKECGLLKKGRTSLPLSNRSNLPSPSPSSPSPRSLVHQPSPRPSSSPSTPSSSIDNYQNLASSSLILDKEMGKITEQDVHKAASSLSRSHVSSLVSGGGVKVSPVHWGDIGGLDKVRKEILNILQLPFLRPDLFPAGCSKRRGILLYGPPGTGKTLVARAVATESGMRFISVKGPELLDVYVGESERNVREVFANAHRSAPCVLFFDELDSLAPARGRGSDGGGVMDRVVSQLLTEIDKLSTEAAPPPTPSSQSSTPKPPSSAAIVPSGVFIIGATNRPDLLDAALLRPGRFDRKIYLSVCKDVSARLQILEAQTRKFNLGDDVILLEVAKFLPDTVTGADIGALSAAAYAKALERTLTQLRERAEKVEAITKNPPRDPKDKEKELGTESPISSKKLSAFINSLSDVELKVLVMNSDFLHAARTIKPSVSRSELDHYEELGEEFNDATS